MNEVSCRGEVGTDVEIREVVGWHPQIAHTAAIEVRAALTVEAPVGGIQHVGDAQLPQFKAVICCGPGEERKRAGCWLTMGSRKEALPGPLLQRDGAISVRREPEGTQQTRAGIHSSQHHPQSFLVGELVV